MPITGIGKKIILLIEKPVFLNYKDFLEKLWYFIIVYWSIVVVVLLIDIKPVAVGINYRAVFNEVVAVDVFRETCYGHESQGNHSC